MIAAAITMMMQMSDNTPITSSVNEWSTLVNWTNAAYIVFLALTVIATILIVFFNNRLNSAKDEAYAHEKLASDEKIAGLTKEAEVAKMERANADKEIAIAKTDAAKANEETARLNVVAENAKKEIALAKADAARADERSAQASIEVASLQVTVAKAEQQRAQAQKALLELQERIKPRILTGQQKTDFITVLKSLPNGKVNLGCTTSSGDEGFRFAQQLLPLFKEAGWNVLNEASISNHLDLQLVGIGILNRGPDPNKPLAAGFVVLTPTMATLQGAFKAIGMNTEFINWVDDIPEVVIGSKP